MLVYQRVNLPEKYESWIRISKEFGKTGVQPRNDTI
jgi:hypothetical protein